MAIASPFDGLDLPQALACEFFAVFSRFEFTLKESGFIRTNRGYAEPAWRDFSSSIKKSLQVDVGSDLESAIAYLVDKPPFVQTAKDQWTAKDLHGATSIEQALDATTRIRNNLFHGGKHTPHSPHGRDERLIRSSLKLLYACLEQNGNLRNTYEQNVF
jgi:hypothetical protein